ncbi:putative ATP-dependent helicase IRC3 [Elasticomyces elasticus]|nr:putative ATP-dependent helicase IRC3 [Elasticomyces elasticus]
MHRLQRLQHGRTLTSLTRRVPLPRVPPWIRESHSDLVRPWASSTDVLETGVLPPQHVAKTVLTTHLRPYQEDAIQAVLDHLDKGEKRLGISLATGGGKTVVFSHLIDRIEAPTANATRTLIIAHKQELVDQAVEHCRRLYPDRVVEVEMAGQHATGSADITVASVPTLNSNNRLQKFDASTFKLLIVDEVHHIVAQSYLNVLRHFGLVDSETKPVTALVGVSATLSRSDGLSLGKALDHIVYHKDYLDMIEGEYLTNVIFTTVQSGTNLKEVKVSAGDFQTSSLSKAINTPEINSLTVRAWLEKAKERKSTLVFAVDVAHVTSLAATFRQFGMDARYVTGSTNKQIRKETVQAFRNGDFPVLLNCGVFTEGTDIPNIDCILLARPTRSRNLLVQMIGRGLRLHAEKQNCHVIDMVSALDSGIVTTPTLFGLNPDEMVDRADAKTMQTMKDNQEEELKTEQSAQGTSTTLPGNVVFTDYDSVQDLIEDTSGDRHVHAISRLAWVHIGAGEYVLSAAAGDLTIARSTDGYDVYFKAAIPHAIRKSSPFMRARHIAHALTLEQAVHAADNFAKDKFVWALVSRTARWRSYPASEGQLKFLNRSRKNGSQLESTSITKGKAGDWITKLKYGAQGHFDRMLSERRKLERSDERKVHKTMKDRSQVAVGPVA